MNCAQAHERLPELLYGDLRAEEKVQLENHLAACPACRQEYASLREVRRLLDRVPAPEVRLDLSRLYRQGAAQQLQQGRRWRRLGLGLCSAAAALVFIALLLRLEVRLQPDQFVLRWQTAPTGPALRPSEPDAQAQVRETAPPAMEEQLQLLSQLIHALADSAQVRDAQQRQELVQLRVELRELQRKTAQWRYATERDMDALYTAQFVSAKKGEKP